MAFPLRLGLNCLTHMLVSASLWWMDGCQHDSVTHSPSCVLLCLDVYFLFLHSSSDSEFLCLQSSHTVCVSFSLSVCAFLGFSQFLAFLIAFLFFSYFPLVAFFLSSVLSIVCQSNTWQVVREKGNSEEGKKHTDKSSFPRARL